MKRTLFVKIIVLALLVAMVAGTVFMSASSVEPLSVTVLNPLGEIEPLVNQPLAERLDSLEGKNVALAFYAKAQNPHAVRAVGEMLERDYGITASLFNIGSAVGAKPLTYYETLAGFDAVVLGVADCTLSAWWAAYHAKMIESGGTPVVVLTHASYKNSLDAGAMDNGFTSVRSAIIDPGLYSSGYRRLTASSNTDYLRNTAFVTTTATVTVSVYDQVKTALSGPLTSAEINPPVISAQQLAGWSSGDPTVQTLTVFGEDEVDATLNFNAMSMDLGFGDGLPLVMPLPELVDEMLAATTRDPADVLGKIMPRGGIITVEKAAINSVMAGARPEYFPVILAAMEAYASSWEDGNLLYHSLTSTENYTMMLLVSGPIVEELGISGQWGYLAGGNEANNGIGRAVRLCIRNIGQNRTQVTDGTANFGRQNDHALTVFGEESRLLPAGWETHSELMGFEPGSSTVTLHGYLATTMYQNAGGVNAAYVPQTVLNTLRNRVVRSETANVVIATIPRGVAAMAQLELGLDSKEDLWANLETTGTAAQRLTSRYLFWPVVVGDPDGGRAYRAADGYYGSQAFQARMITGATLTNAGQGPTAPSAPQNAKATWNGSSATLTWEAPVSDGGAQITGYQVSYTAGSAAGATNPGGTIPTTGTLLNVTNTANNPEAATDSNISRTLGTFPSAGNFVPSWIDVPQGEMTFTFEGLDADAEYIFEVRAINNIKNALQVVGTGNTPETNNRYLDYSASGRGAWAKATVTVVSVD